MAEPYFATYVSLGGLLMRSKAIEAYDWSDLLRDAPKRGVNRVIPGQHGTEVRPRVRGEVRAALLVRVSGAYDQANGPIAASGREAQFYANLAALRAKTTVTETQTVAIVTSHATYSATCQVEDGGTPKFLNPYTAELALDLTLPNGAVAL